MLNKMTEAQRSVLQAAAAREDHNLLPPTDARAAAIKTFADKLIDAGWAKEAKARNGAPVWRKNRASGEGYSFKLSAKGLKAVAAMMSAPGREKPLSVSAAATKTAPQAPAEQTAAPFEAMASALHDSCGKVASTPIRAPRPSSKIGRVVDLLVAETGATISELTAATGWLEPTTRAALTGLRHRGYELSLTRNERDGVSVYRVVGRGEGAAQ